MADIGGMIAGVESPNKRAKIDSGLTGTNFDESKFARYYRTDAVSSSDNEYTTTATSDVSAAAAAATYYSFPYSYSNSFSSFTYPYGQSTPTNGSISYTYASPYGYQNYNNASTQNSFSSADFSSIESAAVASGFSATCGQSSSSSSVTTTSPSTCSYQVTSNSPAHHSTPPSCVIHCRAVADGCKETDLITVLQPFGKITYVTLLPKIRQALVEFESLESAIALVTYAQTNSITVLGRQMFVNYSKSQEIKRDKVLNGDSPSPVSEASNILLLTIINPLHPINVKILHKICIAHGKVLRIVIFHKNGLQALVEYETVESAQRALAALNGQDIFAGCCTLKIDYSKKAKKLNVFKNDEETWDYTGTLSTNTTAALPSKTSLLGTGLLSAMSASDTAETKVPAVSSTNLGMNGKLGLPNTPIPITNEAIARAAAFPTVQSILAKVASLQSSSSKSPKNGKQHVTNQENMRGQRGKLPVMDWSVHGDLDELVETIWNPNPLISHHSPSSSGGTSPGETGKKVGLLGTSPFQLNQAGLLGALPGMQQQHSNGLHVTSSTSQPLNTGGTGCVLMVYGLNHEKMNCERIFNLFCLYGNVVKVKFLTNKPGAAMVQMSDKIASEMIIRNLSGSVIFDSKINIMFSKHPFIADSSVVTALPDGMPSAMNFADNRNNRFKYLPEGQSLKNRYQPPTRMLHFFNAPPNCTVEHLKEVFVVAGALAPLKGTFFSKANAKSSAGLLEMPDIRSAMEALIITNHYTINPPGGGSYTLKLAFSPSSSISPTAPTVAPAVAAAAAVSTMGGLGSLVMPGSPSGSLSNGFMHVNGEGEVLGEGMSPEQVASSP